MQDMLDQLADDNTMLSPVQPPLMPPEYTFEERNRIAQAFFDRSSSVKYDGNLDRHVAVVNDLVSLCTRRERRPRKLRTSWEDTPGTNPSDKATNLEIETTSLDFDVPPQRQALGCQAFQCLYCMGDATLPSQERQHIFGSKHSLQRHTDRHHRFQPGQVCPFPNDDCAHLSFESLMHFKNHAAVVHGIYMSDIC